MEQEDKKDKKDKKDRPTGYGFCKDCAWYGIPNGCDVERDSYVCGLNMGIRGQKWKGFKPYKIK